MAVSTSITLQYFYSKIRSLRNDAQWLYHDRHPKEDLSFSDWSSTMNGELRKFRHYLTLQMLCINGVLHILQWYDLRRAFQRSESDTGQ